MMKYSAAFFTVLAIASWSPFAFAGTTDSAVVLLTVSSPKETYQLGEVLQFGLELRNRGDKPIKVLDAFVPGTGMITILSSLDGQNYLNSNNYGWGMLDLAGISEIRPKSSRSTSADVFWTMDSDGKPQFRFREPGRYYVKATYRLYLGDENGLPFIRPEDGEAAWTLIESEPIRVTIAEPTGPDRAVWERLEANGVFASFLHSGEIRISRENVSERTRFLNQVAEIIAQNPSSAYTEPLRQSMKRYNDREKKRMDLLQTLRRENP